MIPEESRHEEEEEEASAVNQSLLCLSYLGPVEDVTKTAHSLITRLPHTFYIHSLFLHETLS